MRIRPSKLGLVLGVFVGGWHFLWALLVAAGWAQPFLRFVLLLHFISPIYAIAPFNAGIAFILILSATIGGFTCGYLLGLLWNWAQ